MTHPKLTKSNQDVLRQTNIKATGTKKLTHTNCISDTSTKQHNPAYVTFQVLVRLIHMSQVFWNVTTTNCHISEHWNLQPQPNLTLWRRATHIWVVPHS
jgi:hypothetical protein